MSARATLAAMHARLTVEARDLAHFAARRPADDPEAILARDLADDARHEAAALAEALEAMGVELPDPRQLTLLNIPSEEAV